MAKHDVDFDTLWENLLLCAQAMYAHPMTVLEDVIKVARQENVWDEPQIMKVRTTIAKRGLASGLPYDSDSWRYWVNN